MYNIRRNLGSMSEVPLRSSYSFCMLLGLVDTTGPNSSYTNYVRSVMGTNHKTALQKALSEI